MQGMEAEHRGKRLAVGVAPFCIPPHREGRNSRGDFINRNSLPHSLKRMLIEGEPSWEEAEDALLSRFFSPGMRRKAVVICRSGGHKSGINSDEGWEELEGEAPQGEALLRAYLKENGPGNEEKGRALASSEKKSAISLFVQIQKNEIYMLVSFFGGAPRSVMASTPDSHAGGPGFKSRCRPTNFRPVSSPNPSPYPA